MDTKGLAIRLQKENEKLQKENAELKDDYPLKHFDRETYNTEKRNLPYS